MVTIPKHILNRFFFFRCRVERRRPTSAFHLPFSSSCIYTFRSWLADSSQWCSAPTPAFSTGQGRGGTSSTCILWKSHGTCKVDQVLITAVDIPFGARVKALSFPSSSCLCSRRPQVKAVAYTYSLNVSLHGATSIGESAPFPIPRPVLPPNALRKRANPKDVDLWRRWGRKGGRNSLGPFLFFPLPLFRFAARIPPVVGGQSTTTQFFRERMDRVSWEQAGSMAAGKRRAHSHSTPNVTYPRPWALAS